jgi:hypothetical protein
MVGLASCRGEIRTNRLQTVKKEKPPSRRFRKETTSAPRDQPTKGTLISRVAAVAITFAGRDFAVYHHVDNAPCRDLETPKTTTELRMNAQ